MSKLEKKLEEAVTLATVDAIVGVAEDVDAERKRLLEKSNRVIRKLRETKAELAGAREVLAAYDEKVDRVDAERKRLLKKSNRVIRKLRAVRAEAAASASAA